MQFLVIAYDGKDEKAEERRLAARPAHIQQVDKLRDEGKLLFGTAILNDQGKMIGSAIVAEFESRADLDAWISTEPYVIGKVWEKIDIQPCEIGPSFVKK